MSAKSKPTVTKEKKPSGCVRFILFLVQLGLLAILLGLVGLTAGYVYLSDQLADAIDQVVAYQGTGSGGTPRFYDRHGNLLFELTTVEKRRWLSYNEIPADVVNATVTVEDDSFWTNPGIDPAAIGAAVVGNYRNPGSRPVGASTITQQLVRHIAFDYEERVGVSYERKLREIFLAYIMTQQRSKKEILQMYLNEIYYGNLAYGIEAAAQTYFGKSATELNLSEAAFLAGLPQSPIQLDPYHNFSAAKARQELILDMMLADGVIDYITAEVAKGVTLRIQPLITADQQAATAVLEAPHFVLYVQQELERRYGAEALTRGGWQITTSLDLDLQRMTEEAARNWIARRAAPHDVNNASVVVLKPSSGEILTMVGSLDYFNAGIAGQVNVALMPRQPGSSIKPITFAAAMERGWTTADVLWDVPIKLDLGGGQEMTPVNYDRRYRGPVLFRDALANSYNIPPIQLLRDVGITNFMVTARKMGIESLKEPAGYYGLAITLGGGEVTLLEMSRAYATLANMGQRPKLTSVLRITDSRGNVIFDTQQERIPPANALNPGIAYILSDILDDDQARLPAMGYGNDLELAFPTAVKTGTTNDFRDNWTVGYTPGVVVGVWVGNTDGHPMIDSSGLRGAAPLWRYVMEQIYATPQFVDDLMVAGEYPPTEFLPPPGVEEREVCLPQGTGGTRCTASRMDWFVVGQATHGIARIGYNPDVTTQPGAWTLTTRPLPAELGQQIAASSPALNDGTHLPTPTQCVVSGRVNREENPPRLYLPIPPFYPDEVRARVWAQGRGYQMAPATVCPLNMSDEE